MQLENEVVSGRADGLSPGGGGKGKIGEGRHTSTTKLSIRTRNMKRRSSLVSLLQNSFTVANSFWMRDERVNRRRPKTFTQVLQTAEFSTLDPPSIDRIKLPIRNPVWPQPPQPPKGVSRGPNPCLKIGIFIFVVC
jgi:hypothetical protein